MCVISHSKIIEDSLCQSVLLFVLLQPLIKEATFSEGKHNDFN